MTSPSTPQVPAAAGSGNADPGLDFASGQHARTWEQMANQVVILGYPDNVRTAAHVWSVVTTQVNEAITDITRETTQLKTDGAWTGPAYEAFARRVAAVTKTVQTALDKATKPEPISTVLADASQQLAAAQAEMPVPQTLTNEILNARKANLPIPENDFFEAMVTAPLQLVDAAVSSNWFGIRDLNNNYNVNVDDATATYNKIQAQTNIHANKLPAAQNADPGKESGGIKPPPQTSSVPPGGFGGGSPLTGAPDLGNFAGGGAGFGSPPVGNLNTSAAGTGSANAPIGNGGAGSVPNPGSISPDFNQPNGDTNSSRAGSLPGGSGLADMGGAGIGGGFGGSGLGSPESGATNSGGRGLVGPGTGSPFAGGAASGTAIPGGGALGRGVSPPMMPSGMAGAPGQASNSGGKNKRTRDLLTTGKHRPARDDDHKDSSAWKYVDEDIWGSDTDLPPPVLGG